MVSGREGNEAFLAELHGVIAATWATEQDHVECHAASRQVLMRRADELVQHVIARFTSLAQAYPDAERGIQYLAHPALDQEGLPACHSLVWQLTQPARKLEITVSRQTGRYWLHLVRLDGVRDVAAALRCERDGDVRQLSVEDIDALIRVLADQQGW